MLRVMLAVVVLAAACLSPVQACDGVQAQVIQKQAVSYAPVVVERNVGAYCQPQAAVVERQVYQAPPVVERQVVERVYQAPPVVVERQVVQKQVFQAQRQVVYSQAAPVRNVVVVEKNRGLFNRQRGQRDQVQRQVVDSGGGVNVNASGKARVKVK